MKGRIQIRGTLLVAVVLLCASASHGTVIWDESVNGDLSNNGTAPTSLPALTVGSNRVVGSIGVSWSDDDEDAAMFTVPVGSVLSELILESYSCGTFYDYAPFSLHRGSSTSGPMVEFILLTDWGAGTDLLQFDSAPGAQPAGVYTFHFDFIQQSGGPDERSLYSVALNLTPVPEPSSMVLLGIGLAGLVKSRIRREKK